MKLLMELKLNYYLCLVFRHTLFQLKLWLKRWLQKLFHLEKYWLAPKSTAGTNSTKSNLNEEDTTGRAHEDQWVSHTYLQRGRGGGGRGAIVQVTGHYFSNTESILNIHKS